MVLDEVEPRTIRDYAGFLPIRVRELDGFKYARRRDGPGQDISQSRRDYDKRAARESPSLPPPTRSVGANAFERGRRGRDRPRVAQVQIALQAF